MEAKQLLISRARNGVLDISIDLLFFLRSLAQPLFDSISIVGDRPVCAAEYNEGKRNFRRVNYEPARKIAISRMLRHLLLRQAPLHGLPRPAHRSLCLRFSLFFFLFTCIHKRARR